MNTQQRRLAALAAARAFALTLALTLAGARAADPLPATTLLAPRPAASAAAEALDPQLLVARMAERQKQHPDDLQGWQMLGRAYTALGEPQQAIGAYRRVVALSPRDAQGHADLGRAIGAANGHKLTPEAEAQLDQALALDPGNVMAHALLGRVALERHQPAAARKHFQDALARIDPEHPFAEQLRDALRIADSALAASAPTRTH